MKGVSNKEYVEIIDIPVNKQEKYLYQILISISELIEIVKKYNIPINVSEPILESVKRGRKRKGEV